MISSIVQETAAKYRNSHMDDLSTADLAAEFEATISFPEMIELVQLCYDMALPGCVLHICGRA